MMPRQTPDPERPEGLIDAFAEGIRAASADRLLELFTSSPDSVYVGSEAREIAVGPDEMRALFAHGLARGERYRIKWRRRHVSAVDPFAWVTAVGTIATDVDDWSRQTSFRLTALAEREGTVWKFRQVHCSEPVGDFWPGFSGPLPSWAI